jgi:hypothetical protein
VISIFNGKYGSRYKIRNKLDEILWSHLSKIELLLPFLAKKALQRKLKKVLGYSLLYYYIYNIVSTMCIMICLIDSVINYESKRNTEIMNYDANLKNGSLDMKRDANLQLLAFFHSYDDIRAVFICKLIN